MDNLDLDAMNRAIDHNDKMERMQGFTEWEEVKLGIGPMVAVLTIVCCLFWLVSSLWGSL